MHHILCIRRTLSIHNKLHLIKDRNTRSEASGNVTLPFATIDNSVIKQPYLF